MIRGQNAISHPSLPPATSPASSHPSGRAYNDASNLVVDKESQVRLSSRIKRVFYVSPDQPVTQGSQILEIYPHVHSAVPGNIYEADGIIYAMGSFYTSICPSLVLKGVGEAVARRRCRKILILNGGLDRETSKMTKASDYVRALVDHLNRAYAADPAMRLDNPPSSYVNCLFVPRGGEAIEVDEAELKRMGIRKIVEVEASKPPDALVFTKDEAKTRIVSSSSSTLDLAAIPPENKEHQLLYDTADLIRMLKKVLANARKSSDSFMSTNGIAGGGSSTSLASLAHATMASIPLPEDPMSDDSDEEWVSDHEVG